LYTVNNTSITDIHTVSTEAVGLPYEQYIFLSLVAMLRNVSLREVDISHILY